MIKYTYLIIFVFGSDIYSAEHLPSEKQYVSKPMYPIRIPGPIIHLQINNESKEDYSIYGFDIQAKIGFISAQQPIYSSELLHEWVKASKNTKCKSLTLALENNQEKTKVEIWARYCRKNLIVGFITDKENIQKEIDLDPKKGIPDIVLNIILKGENLEDSSFEVNIINKSIESLLDIKKDSLEKTIFELAKQKQYEKIKLLIHEKNDLKSLKNLLLFQLDLALFIVERIAFDISIEEVTAFAYPEQKIILTNNPFAKIRSQWIYLLLQEKNELKKIQSLNEFLSQSRESFMLINSLLFDLGYRHDPAFQKIDVKLLFAEYFQPLFEILPSVMYAQPSLELKIIKEKMKKIKTN